MNEAVAYWPIVGELALLLIRIDYDVNDMAVVRWSNETEDQAFPIQWDQDEDARSFIQVDEGTYYFDECLRV